MGQPYVGEIRMFAGNFAPAGWLLCDSTTPPLAISENEVLFQLIGTTYGGDGQSTFRVPNLSSRVPIHLQSNVYTLGQAAGTEQETLTIQQIPAHNHPVLAATSGATAAPTGALLTVPTSNQQGVMIYNNSVAPATQLHPSTIGPSGGSQPHENTQPFLCINFIISLFGLYPQPN
jgi:microcystin-dependent protein